MPLPAVYLHEKGGVLVGSGICRILRELQTRIESPRSNEGIRDNIQLSWKRQRAVAGKPNNDPSLSPPHVESTATASLRTSYRNVKRNTLVGTERYERAAGRDAYHSGHYAKRLITGIAEIELSMPKLGGTTARTALDGLAETLAYTEFPSEHWRRIRTNNGVKRINREIRRRTRAVGTFLDGNSALMLVTARL